MNGVGSLRGAHNWQNAAVAVAVARALGVAPEPIRGIGLLPGLPHRMEEVGRRAGLFVNDSKATNADSTEKALTAFRDIHWILGGKAKDGGIFPSSYFERVAHAYLIGAASDAFAATLREGACLHPLRHPRRGGGEGRGERRRLGRAGARRPALPRLRVLRPVQELRGARRPVPGVGEGAS